ncbi:MAG TPA: hypothetical protein VIY48_01825 [Candidatus Paceibacterota bacterium]
MFIVTTKFSFGTGYMRIDGRWSNNKDIAARFSTEIEAKNASLLGSWDKNTKSHREISIETEG